MATREASKQGKDGPQTRNIGLHLGFCVARSVTKKVRMTPERADRLAELAETLGTSESEVLRQGLAMVERVKARHENIHRLIDLARGEEPEKIRFPLDP